jgi:CRP/FNR family transcriptional regulator, anaerobic regulatory protein
VEAKQRLRKLLSQLEALSTDEWERFEGMVEEDTFDKNDFLTREGQVERYIYFICEGIVRVFFTDKDKEISLDFAFEGTFTTSYASFLQQQPSVIYIEALTEKLYRFYDQSQKAERIGRLIAEANYIRKNNREISFLKFTAKERYLQLLEEHPKLVQEIPIKFLASYLGIKPESLSRIRRTV